MDFLLDLVFPAGRLEHGSKQSHDHYFQSYKLNYYLAFRMGCYYW